ncbi:MAG: hypothetical protein FWC55_03655, partial [Firmicutes bacterium]|nr:hypothetical protein [Bacillota bacterium]
MKKLKKLLSAVLALTIALPVSAFSGVTANAALPVGYSTSWIGNTFGGVDNKWVQNLAYCMYVSPDGTCYLNSNWDEGGRECGIYKDGDVIGSIPVGHGNGGYAIAGDSTYIYASIGHGIGRYYPDGTRAAISWSGANPISNSLILGIASANGRLYLSDDTNSKVRIIDISGSSW